MITKVDIFLLYNAAFCGKGFTRGFKSRVLKLYLIYLGKTCFANSAASRRLDGRAKPKRYLKKALLHKAICAAFSYLTRAYCDACSIYSFVSLKQTRRLKRRLASSVRRGFNAKAIPARLNIKVECTDSSSRDLKAAFNQIYCRQ